jgi:nucleoid-associated protein EbfC
LVKATVNGKKQLISLDIDPDLLKPEDREMLQDLVIAATNKALLNIDEQIKAHLGKSTEGLMPNIPGMDLGSLFK